MSRPNRAKTMAQFGCKHIRKSFGGVDALNDISVSFPTKGIAAIIGPNGAGKTTLINILSGFLLPDNGECSLGDRNTTRLAPYRLAALGIGRTFQDLRLIRQVSVLENVMLAIPAQRGEKLLGALTRIGVAAQEERNRSEALRLLELVEMESKANELAGELSYGQQKMIAITCCLATGATLMLLDEPVAGVHPRLIERILDLLACLRDAGKVIVFIEHDIAAVRKAADTVFVMDEGRLIAQGAPGEVLERPEILEAYVG